MANPPTATLPAKSALDDIEDHLSKAAITTDRTLQRIAKAKNHLRRAQVDTDLHLKSIEQWRETLGRKRP